MVSRELQLLLIEDNPADAELAQELLMGVPGCRFQVSHVRSLTEAAESLCREKMDAVVLDLGLPESLGTDTVRKIRTLTPRSPIVVLTGLSDDTVRMEALREGAQDVISKGDTAPSLLARSVLYAVERHRAQEEHRQVEGLVDASPDAVLVVDQTGVVRFVNDAAERLFGRPKSELLGELLGFSVSEGTPIEIELFPGERRVGEIRVAQFEWNGTPSYLATIRDVTAERQLRFELHEAQARLRQVLSRSAAILYSARLASKFVDAYAIELESFAFDWISDSLTAILGYQTAEALEPGWWYRQVHPDDRSRALEEVHDVLARQARSTEYRIRHRDGSYRWISSSVTVVVTPDDGVPEIIGVWIDVTERKSLESQFHQAQKMEAVGRLAGGVAHDFNNMLMVILSGVELLQDDEDAARPELDEIRGAAEHAATLTRQLLAFSRRQVMRSSTVNLNQVVAGTEKMLRRLIGEDIELVARLAPELGQVQADPGQIEQIVINLAVNARDAMPDGGQLTIETANTDIDEDYASRRPIVQPGHYVMLAISDTGVGMDEATQTRIFEPFFTTKEQGKGTGLGLAMVYGVVKQSGGFIWTYSEVGRGTTFKIYLPRIERGPHAAARLDAEPNVHRGEGTILLVDDDPRVRALTARYLRRCGYEVLAAESGEAALQHVEHAKAVVDLVITDVAMPGMGGVALAAELQSRRPSLPVVFTSGYATDAIVRHGVLAEGVPFLQKPFSLAALAKKIQELLALPS